MSTQMIEVDWEVALEVFRLCLQKHGVKAKNDRLFLEALHFFAAHNITRQALPDCGQTLEDVYTISDWHTLIRAGV